MLIRLDVLDDGVHLQEWTGSIEGIDLAYPEIVSTVHVVAKIHRLRDVITVRAEITADLERPCDRTLDPVAVELAAQVHVVIRQLTRGTDGLEDEGEHIISVSPEDISVDLTDHIREGLIVEMPMVVYKDGTDSEVYSAEGSDEDGSSDEDDIDPRWSGLKSIKF